jgi:superfamily II DNA helicase RecQ
VGLTRAKRVLWVSWSGKRSRFVKELGVEPTSERTSRSWSETGEKLRAWRLRRARADGVPPYVVFHDSVLQMIADARPSSLGELSQIPGIGPAKLERYGADVLGLVES